jgi:hypothetical protein
VILEAQTSELAVVGALLRAPVQGEARSVV